MLAVVSMLLAQLVQHQSLALRTTRLIAPSQPFQLLISTYVFQLHCLRFAVTLCREATIFFPPLQNPAPGNI